MDGYKHCNICNSNHKESKYDRNWKSHLKTKKHTTQVVGIQQKRVARRSKFEEKVFKLMENILKEIRQSKLQEEIRQSKLQEEVFKMMENTLMEIKVAKANARRDARREKLKEKVFKMVENSLIVIKGKVGKKVLKDNIIITNIFNNDRLGKKKDNNEMHVQFTLLKDDLRPLEEKPIPKLIKENIHGSVMINILIGNGWVTWTRMGPISTDSIKDDQEFNLYGVDDIYAVSVTKMNE